MSFKILARHPLLRFTKTLHFVPSIYHYHQNRRFSSQLENIRLTHDISPAAEFSVFNIINENSPRLSDIESDLIVIPVYYNHNNTVFQGILSPSIQSSESDPETPEIINFSNLFDYESGKLNDSNGQILTKLLNESQFLTSKTSGKYKYIIARVSGLELEFSFPKKIAVICLGSLPASKFDSKEYEFDRKDNNLLSMHLQQTRGLANIITNIMSENKYFKSCSIYLSQQTQIPIQSLIESLNLCIYGKDSRFKNISNGKPPSKLKKYTILSDKKGNENGNKHSIILGECISSGMHFAQELINAPANIMTPKNLAKVAVQLANEKSFLSVKILNEEQCQSLNMNAFLCVSACSKNEPQFIHLTLNDGNNDGNKQKICLIGKGVTFDSGGYNIKAGANSSIELMKYDMAGSAAVMGTFATLCKYFEEYPAIAKEILREYEIHGVIAACENMISGDEHSLHPGDIIVSAEGISIEVNNTDAEGRLTLADAIWYARHEIGADSIIDLATLTGAIKVALGNKIAGYYCNDDQFAVQLKNAGFESGERLWRMPLFADDMYGDMDGELEVDGGNECGEHSYMSALESDFADIKNSGSGGGGSITAALFLKRFVDSKKYDKESKRINWAHFDIAGPAWGDKVSHEQKSVGGSGFGVRLLTQYILNRIVNEEA